MEPAVLFSMDVFMAVSLLCVCVFIDATQEGGEEAVRERERERERETALCDHLKTHPAQTSRDGIDRGGGGGGDAPRRCSPRVDWAPAAANKPCKKKMWI